MKVILLLLAFIAVVFTGYNPSLARKLGIVETATYTSVQQIQTWTCPHCKQFPLAQTKAFNSSILDIYGLTGYSEQQNAIIVGFRGTIDIQNWIADLDAAQIPYPSCSGCLIHQGFYNAFQTVQGYVRANIEKLMDKHQGSKIYVTGFSLGGALATVAALQIQKDFGKVDQFVTFGQPRVGNAAFVAYFSQKIPSRYRVIHYADIVSHLPPQIPNPYYAHFSAEIWYDERMQNYIECGAEDQTCSRSIPPNRWSSSDHDLEVYIKMPTSSLVRQ